MNTGERKESLSMKQAAIARSNGMKLRNGQFRKNLKEILLTVNSISLWTIYQQMYNREQSWIDKERDSDDLLGLFKLRYLWFYN